MAPAAVLHRSLRSALPPALRALSLAGVVLACAAGAEAQARVPRLAFASWGTEQGLPSNISLDIDQSPDGYLWVASYQGMVRFDGVTFRTFAETDIPGLDRASFTRVAVDSAGVLWAASERDGLVRYAEGRWSILRTADGLKSDKVTALLPDTGGALWVGTRTGVSRVRRGRIDRLPAPRGMAEPSVTDLARDAEGNLWIGTVAGGLLRYRDGVYTAYGAAQGLSDPRVNSLTVDSDGSVWVGTYDSGVTHIHRGVLTRRATDGAGAPRRVNDFLRGPDGVLWVAADNGLFTLEGDRATPVLMPGGRPLSQVASLFLDREGSLWAGSRHGGIFRLRAATVATLSVADGLPHDLVSAIAGDGADGAWIATQGGAAHLGPGGARRFTRAGGLLADDIARDILRSRGGDVWVATNGGLTRIRGDRAVTFGPADGLVDVRVRALHEARDGALWAGTYNGLAELKDGRFRSYGQAEGLLDPYILSVFEDRRGTVWVGTQSEGLFRRVGGRFVPGPRELARQPVFRMMEDADGTLWVGSARGLARIRGDRVFLFTARHGLVGNAVFQALDDGLGRLWLTGPWGVGHVQRHELEAVAEGRAPTLTMKQYGSRDGMAAREASSISRAWRAPDGILWFGTPAGIATIDPARLEPNTRAPIPLLERVVVDGSAHERAAALRVRPGTRKLEFHFTAASFVAPEQLRFRFRLDGYDTEWVEGSTGRVAYYTNLPPGEYVFRVEARNEDGVPSVGVASVRLRLLPHFWETGWFALLIATALAMLAYAAHLLRVSMVQHALREEMLRDLSLHDDLTGLYNRRGLLALAEQVIRESQREQRGFDVVFADLDGLKRINDTLGHPAGDRALRDAATLIRGTFREADVVARLGGDEFAVLVRGDAQGASVAHACTRLLQAVERHNERAGRPYQLALSVGFCGFDPQAPQGIEALLEEADRQMYLQKRRRHLART